MKVLIIDDHKLLLETLILVLKKQINDIELFSASCVDEAKKILIENKDCSVLILDIQIGNENGLELLRELRKISPNIKTLICTAFYEPLIIENAIKMNVQGFITKTSELQEIILALNTVVRGEEYFCSQAQKIMKKNLLKIAYGYNDSSDYTTELFSKYKTLSIKEREIFELLSKKMNINDIAKQLGKSIKTVENQRTAIYSKMNIHDRLDVVEAAKILGIL